MKLALLAALFLAASGVSLAQTESASTCQPCHREIYATQSATRMARTWLGRGLAVFPAGAPITKNEGSAPAIAYSLRRNQDRLEWRVNMPGRLPFSAPVEVALGGDRHGFSLLARVSSIDGVKLDRAPLVETRHLLGPDRDLLFSPGHSLEKPASFQTSIGRVLSSQFEAKCLACHGAPTGIRCEHCHGSGVAHVNSHAAIQNPAKLSNAAQIERCGQCHANPRPLADPRPEDLLISNQATALRESECYIQSGQGLNCSTCHDPHRDSPPGDSRYVKACLSCHSAGAATCPVNPEGDCIRCHMPSRAKDSFQITDHWIRVPQSGSPRAHVSRRQTVPKRMFLRMILAQSAEEGEELRSQLNGPARFFELARRYSKDASAQSGGFLGAMWLDQMEPRLAEAAARLDYGEVSPVVRTPAGHILLQRLPRDFRWQANALFVEAAELKRKGQLQAAMEKNQRALETYPTFLRALLFLGISLGEQGDMGRSVGVLEFAERLYPQDPGVQLNLGIAYGATGRIEKEIAAYLRALDGEPDLIPAYLNLGAAQLAAGRVEQAAETYRAGVQVNPLSAAMYYNLSIVYSQQGKTAEARRMSEIAAKIEPRAAEKKE